MNIWTRRSIEIANQENYLDLLFDVYPMSVNLRRCLSQRDINDIERFYDNKDGINLLNVLLRQEVFPIKDSYVAYFKRDRGAILRNPNTVTRLTNILFNMSLETIFDKTTAPKETNRQIGPLFKRWIDLGYLGFPITNDKDKFLARNDDVIFNTNDQEMKDFAHNYLGYDRDKGLDFIAKIKGKYILGEAKFLTDFGGHQNAQFEDALGTLNTSLRETAQNVSVIAILDGVLYIESRNKMYSKLCNGFNDDVVILSALLLREVRKKVYLFMVIILRV